MKVSGILPMRLDMDVAIKFGRTEVFMKVTGKMIRLTDVEDLYTRMEIFMTVIGKMIRLMGLVSILILMVHNMKVIGLMISNTDKVKRLGRMVLNMKATISLGKKMASVSFCGLINLVIAETFSIIIFTVTVPISGQTAVSFQETGFVTKCMEMEFSHGLTGENMKVSM